MSSVSAVEGGGNVFGLTGNNSRAINTEDFLKILIAELTHQDPFEPVKNQDLLAQIASIQQLDSSQNLSQTFGKLGNQFAGFLEQQQLNSAAQLIGQYVSGTTPAGRLAVGKVVAVNIDGGNIMLELNTGEVIGLDGISRLGGSNSDNIIGTLVIKPGLPDEDLIVGRVKSLKVKGDQVTLQLESGEEVALEYATVITPERVDLLLRGRFVEGKGPVQGFVEGYRIDGPGIEGVTLILDEAELPLTDLIKIKNTQS